MTAHKYDCRCFKCFQRGDKPCRKIRFCAGGDKHHGACVDLWTATKGFLRKTVADVRKGIVEKAS